MVIYQPFYCYVQEKAGTCSTSGATPPTGIKPFLFKQPAEIVDDVKVFKCAHETQCNLGDWTYLDTAAVQSKPR